MAKSLRSKRKRAIRAEKRIVNAKKELVKLKEVAARLHGTTGGLPLSKESLESADIPDMQISDVAPMSVDGESDVNAALNKKAATVINTKWMNQKKIKAIKGQIKRHNKKKARRGRGGRK